MQVISYVNYENTDSKCKKRKMPTDNGINSVAGNINSQLMFKYAPSEVQASDEVISVVKVFLISGISILVLSAIVLLVFFEISLKTKLSTYEFYELADSKSAIQEYLFPEPEESLANVKTPANLKEILTEVEIKNYTIKPGDTISGVAYKFGLKSIGTLIALNSISNVKKLQVGKELKIPSMDGLYHTVTKGQTISEIAGRYGLTLNSLLDANDLKSETINPGQKLFIPGATLSNFELKKALGELFIYPVYGRLTSPFGYRRDPFTGLRSFHNGIDIANRRGTSIKCIMDGRVSKIGYNNIYGNFIIIVHQGGYQSLYGHLQSIFVKRGSYVSQGTKIGSMGNTGRSTGPHLHISIYKNGKVINPLSVLQK